MKQYDIVKALATATIELAEAMTLTVDLPDVPFTIPSDGSPYLEVRHFPAGTQGLDWGDHTSNVVGIWQVAYVTTDHDGSASKLKTDQIGNFFHKGAEFWFGETVVKIDQPPSLLTTLVSGQKATHPVSVRYRC